MIPTFAATLSPKLLLIAKPGNYSYLNQTLYGPINPSLSSLYCSTLPPAFIILSFS